MPLRPRDWFKAQAAAGASRRDYDDLSTKFFMELINDPTFFQMPVEEQLSLFDELDQAKNDLPNDGVMQSFWNAVTQEVTTGIPKATFELTGIPIAERLMKAAFGGGTNITELNTEAGKKAYELLGGNEYQPQTVGEKVASYPAHAGAGILKTIPYLAAAGAALPAAPVAAAAIGFGGAAAVEGLSDPERPLTDVAESTAIQSGLGAAFGLVGKLGEVAKWMTPVKETALQAGVGVGGSLLNTQVLNPETPAEDAWIDALAQAGLPFAFHGLGFPTAAGARLAREARAAEAKNVQPPKEPAAPGISDPTVTIKDAGEPEVTGTEATPETPPAKVRPDDDIVPPEARPWLDRWFSRAETAQMEGLNPTELEILKSKVGGQEYEAHVNRLRQTPPRPEQNSDEYFMERMIADFESGNLPAESVNGLRLWATAARAAYEEAGGPALSPEAHASKSTPAAFRDGATSTLWRALTGWGGNRGAIDALETLSGGPEKLLEYGGIAKRLASLQADKLNPSKADRKIILQNPEEVRRLAGEQLQELLAGRRPTRVRAGKPWGREAHPDEIDWSSFDQALAARIGERINTLTGVKVRPAGSPKGMSEQLTEAARATGTIPALLMPRLHSTLTDAMVRGLFVLGGIRPSEFWSTFGVAEGGRFAPEILTEVGAKRFYESASLTGKGLLSGLYASLGKNTVPGYAKRVIGIFGKANASTVRHELGHMFYDLLPPGGKATYNAALGLAKGETPSTRDHEAIAEMFRLYTESGTAPSERLAGLFDLFKEWSAESARPFVEEPVLRALLTPEVRAYTDELFRSGETGRPASTAPAPAQPALPGALGSETPARPEVKSSTVVEPKTERWEAAPVGVSASGAISKLDVVGRKQTHQLRRNVELGEQGRYESFRTKDGRVWFRVPGGPLAFTEPAAAGRALHQHLADSAQKAPLTMQDVQSTVARYVSLFTASHSRRERSGWNPNLLLDSLESLPRLSIDGQSVDLAGLLKTGQLVDIRLDPKSGRWVTALKEHPSKAVQAIGVTAERFSATMARLANTWWRPLKRVMAGRYGQELLIADDRLTNTFQLKFKPLLDELNDVLAGKRGTPWLPGRKGGLSTDEARSLVHHIMTEVAPTDPKLKTAYDAIRDDLLTPAIDAEAKIEGVEPVVIRARYLHDLIQRLPGRHGKSIIRELGSGEAANSDLAAHAERIAKFVLTERKRIKPTEAEYNELLDSFRSVGINAANISDAQVGIVFQDIAHKLAMHRANEAEGYRFQKAIQAIKLRETDPRRLEELDAYAAMVKGGGLGGGYLYADIPGLPGFHKTTVLGALLGRSLLAQSLQGLAQVAKLPLRDVTAGFGGMLAQIGKAAKGKGKFDPLGVTAGGIVSHAGPRAVLDRIEAYHPFGQLEKTVRVWGEKALTSNLRRLGRKAARGDLLAIREIQESIGAQQRALETVIRWATDQIPPGEIMPDTGLPYEVFQFVARGTREVALPYEAQARPSEWTKSEFGKLMTGMQHFSFAQFYYLKDQIWGDLQKAFRAFHTEGNTTLAQQYATRAAGRAVKVAVVGPAVGTLINTIWKAVTGQWDKSIAKQLSDLDDDTKSDAKQALELYGRAMLDAGYMGIAADLMNSAYKLAKGERNEYARDSLGFNLAKLQDAVKYLNDLGTQTSRLVQGQPGAATTLGKQTLRFGESLVPALKVVEMPRSWGGQGLTDITDPDVAQDRYRKAISAARQSGNQPETRRLLAGYGRWLADQSRRTTDPRRRAQYRNALRRLTSRRPRGRITTEE